MTRITGVKYAVLGLALSGFTWGGRQPVDNSKFIEKNQLVYTGNTVVGHLKFAVNSSRGDVVQVSLISEAEPKKAVMIPYEQYVKKGGCPDGFQSDNAWYISGSTSVTPSTQVECKPVESPKIHEIEIPTEDVPNVIMVLDHFKKKLDLVNRPVTIQDPTGGDNGKD